MKSHSILIFLLLLIFPSLCEAQFKPSLWGMTQQGGTFIAGTIFNTKLSTYDVTNAYDFAADSTDGYWPYGSLMQASNGLLYGMTLYGGTNNMGTIFSYDISTGIEADLHDFGNGTDGNLPTGSLIQASNGLIYGLTPTGGAHGKGIIFSYNIATGKETDIYDFANREDGKNPYGCSLLQASNGVLYGMTYYGGFYSVGTIFSYDISTSKEADVHDFGSGTEGQHPDGSLIQANNGLLYGMTYQGGTNTTGTIFNYDISVGTENDIHDFGTTPYDGRNPMGSLIQASNGLLYGMTSKGGFSIGSGGGTIFSYDISTLTEKDIHDFGRISADGRAPAGSLIQASNSLLYGMTPLGGVNTTGMIFSYDISTDSEADILDFGNTFYDAKYPYGNLIEINTITGINQITSSVENVQLYPNPASSSVHFSINMQKEESLSLRLCNALGQQVWGQDLEKTRRVETTIPLVNLADGVYILKINAGGSLQQKEMVVAR